MIIILVLCVLDNDLSLGKHNCDGKQRGEVGRQTTELFLVYSQLMERHKLPLDNFIIYFL